MIMQQCPGVTITVDEKPLPFPDGCDATPLHQHMETVYETPLDDAIADTIHRFRQLESRETS
jgi:hypothetical protein